MPTDELDDAPAPGPSRAGGAVPGGDGRSQRAEEARERRREDLLDAAFEVFARQGFHGTRVADIIAHAGVARGTFYLYFDNKNAIFLELVDRLLRRLRSRVIGVDIEDDAPPVEVQLHATVGRIVEALESQRPLATILFREAVGLDDQVDRRLQGFYGGLAVFIEESLDNGKALGIVRPDLDYTVVAACILGT
ncbi:MAG TPA: helix-turn-helix domain-containing protein, partial [Polyangiaceae bacterium LLY-WYZ-14_1]|nr:helix-turn-helix domain-containing protein [Polyangiaceae bacterium LLY-WYZ-14_1]